MFMEEGEKKYRKLRFGLALKKLMQKTDTGSTVAESDSGYDTRISFRELESSSGIRHASIVNIVNGKKNPSWSTIDAILEGLEISLTDFARVYDAITDKEILAYQKELDKKVQARTSKRTPRKRTAGKGR